MYMNDPPVPRPVPGRRRGRMRLLVGTAAAVMTIAAAILPTTAANAANICSNQTGSSNGYYYQMWSNGQGSACINVGSGSYTSSWSGIGDFVAGVGWNPGSNHTVSFSSSLNASGGTTLISLYGWSTNPLVEYYVEENYNGSPNTAGTYMGQMTSDGGTYNIYEHQQVNQPCITGNNCTFEQYLAIRTSPVSSGTITTQNFFNAWASHGMNLGTMNYQIMATEAWGGGSGNSSVTVSAGSSPPPSSPPPSSPPPSSPPPSSPPPSSPPPGGSCHVTYVPNQWPGGFTANVTIANNSSSTINGWTLTFTFPGDQKLTNAWSATYTQSGENVTLKNVSYNPTIPPGGNTSIGFQGTWTSNDTSPSSFALNGTACT